VEKREAQKTLLRGGNVKAAPIREKSAGCQTQVVGTARGIDRKVERQKKEDARHPVLWKKLGFSDTAILMVNRGRKMRYRGERSSVLSG